MRTARRVERSPDREIARSPKCPQRAEGQGGVQRGHNAGREVMPFRATGDHKGNLLRHLAFSYYVILTPELRCRRRPWLPRIVEQAFTISACMT